MEDVDMMESVEVSGQFELALGASDPVIPGFATGQRHMEIVAEINQLWLSASVPGPAGMLQIQSLSHPSWCIPKPSTESKSALRFRGTC
jgi:hypothetical protein